MTSDESLAMASVHDSSVPDGGKVSDGLESVSALAIVAVVTPRRAANEPSPANVRALTCTGSMPAIRRAWNNPGQREEIIGALARLRDELQKVAGSGRKP